MIEHQISRGLTATYTKKTNTNDTYASSDSAALNYLVSTPSVILMAIDAATEMLDKYLPSEYITVGRKIELVHENPSLVGETITLKLVVEDVTNNLVVLNLEASDSKGLICSGKYERAIINAAKLLDIAYKRAPELI